MALFGGFCRDGKWTPRRHTVTVSPIGGVDIDLTEVVLPGDGLTITKVSLVGIELIVPAETDVEVRGSASWVAATWTARPKGAGSTGQLNVYGVIGGVQVRRASRWQFRFGVNAGSDRGLRSRS